MRVSRVNGPVVEVTGATGLGMLELVEVGAARLPGEVIALDGDGATVQVYEYTGGLRPGESVVGQRRAALGGARPRPARRCLRRDAPPARRGRRLDRDRRAAADAAARTQLGVRARRRARRRPGDGPRGRGDRASRPRPARRRGRGRMARAARLLHRRRPDRAGRRPGAPPRTPLAGSTTATRRRPAPRRRAARDRPARARPLLPDRPWLERRRPGRLRHRQDGAPAADRQALRRRRDRVRRLRRARQRDGGRARGAAEAGRSAHRAPADGAHRPDREHVEHACARARGEHPHRRHGRGVLPRHGPRRRPDRRLDLAVGRGAARGRLADGAAPGGRGLPGGARLGAGRLLRAGGQRPHARGGGGVGDDPRRGLARPAGT